MSEEYQKLLLSVEELKVKIPSLLDLIDEVIARENRFRSIDEKTNLIIEQLTQLKKELQSLNFDNKKVKELIEDDRNVSAGIVFIEEMLKRKDTAFKEYIKSCIITDEVSNLVGEALLKNKEILTDHIFNTLENKFKLYIGARVIAGAASIGIILGIIFMGISLAQKYL